MDIVDGQGMRHLLCRQTSVYLPAKTTRLEFPFVAVSSESGVGGIRQFLFRALARQVDNRLEES